MTKGLDSPGSARVAREGGGAVVRRVVEHVLSRAPSSPARIRIGSYHNRRLDEVENNASFNEILLLHSTLNAQAACVCVFICAYCQGFLLTQLYTSTQYNALCLPRVFFSCHNFCDCWLLCTAQLRAGWGGRRRRDGYRLPRHNKPALTCFCRQPI